jgi:hypothetical protein
MVQMIASGATVEVSKEQVSCDLNGEAAILNLKNGVYYSLDSVGARIWQLIQQPRKVHEIRGVVLEEYDVEPERCDRDLQELLQKLATEGLIEVKE